VNEIREARPGTVSILIGPNGSGKSRKLRNLCDEALRDGRKVIAISPTIYDRFLKIRSPNFRFFGARQGRGASKRVVRDLIVRAALEDPQILKNLVQALKHTNFDSAVGVSLDWVDLNRFHEVTDELKKEIELGPRKREELQAAILLWRSGHDRENMQPWDTSDEWEGRAILKFSIEDFSFNELHRITYVSLLQYESLLVKWKVIAQPKYYFFRNGLPIPLLEACSGELCFITSIAFITGVIEENCWIMVDEPENSLHPTWQKQYVSIILDLFYNYQPRVVISTHSPILVSGGELADQKTRVFEMADGNSEECPNGNLNLEEMYERLFGVVTPKNHYLSTRSVDLLNDLSSGEMSLHSVIGEFDSLIKKSYDPKQVAVINKIKDLARQLADQRRGR
jgi:hypothetical protein